MRIVLIHYLIQFNYALKDRNRWAEIGENCREFAIEYLDTKKIISSMNNIYEKITFC